MAVTTLNLGYIPEKGINYTHMTDSSSDWASVPNSTYFYDKTDKLVHYKDSTGAVLEVFTQAGVASTRSISTNSPLSGGGNLSTDLTLSIGDAAADGTTKGAATFSANDFNSATGLISIDYTNAQAASSSNKGFLTSTDWSTFNGKQDALGYTPENVANKSNAALDNDTTKYPTNNAVKTYVDGSVVGLWDDRGTYDASGGSYPSTGGSGTSSTILKGDIWTISVAGTLPTGQVVEIGDTVRALVDSPGNTQSNWGILQNNIGYVPANSTLTISTNSPLSGGGDLSTNRTLSISDAAADDTTKGAATFAASDFNSSAGLISIDYTNGQTASASNKGFLTSSDWTTFNNKVSTTRNISTNSPLSGGGDLSADRTLSIADAAADGATKGAATFTASDFNSASGVISLDYANGQTATSLVNGFLSSTDWTTFNGKVSTTRSISTSSPLSGGGDLSADRTLSISDAAADGTTKGAATFTASDFNSASGVISIDYTNAQSASGSTKGFLTSGDWTTFNSKQGAITLTTTGNSGAATLIGNTLNIPQYAGTSAIASLNGLTDATQTFATGTTGTDFNISSATGTHTFNIPTASATNRGALSTSDWTTFNNKVATTRTISTTSPLSGGGDLSSNLTLSIAEAAADGTTKGVAAFNASDFDSTSGVISIDYSNAQAASSTLKGFLTSGDWTTFNNKVATSVTIATSSPLSGGGDLSSNRTISIQDAVADGTTKGAAAFDASDFNSVSGVISLDYTNAQTASSTLKGFLTAADWTTFNNKVATTRTISTTSPLSGGGDLSTNLTLGIAEAAADGTTKGVAAFTANDFNATAGVISIDYTNGQAASASAKGFLTSTDWTTFNNKLGSTIMVAGTGTGSTIRDGNTNTATCAYSTVSGGCANTVSSCYSVISGGNTNSISTVTVGIYPAVAQVINGGTCNRICATSNSGTIPGGNTISGGWCNVINTNSNFSVITGGQKNTLSGNYAVLGGGCGNTASGYGSILIGGSCNTASGYKSFIGNGFTSTASGFYSTVVGGGRHTASGCYSSILGGRQNTTSGRYSTIVGGHYNTITGATVDSTRGSFIGGGHGHNNSGGTVNATTGRITGIITCCNVGAYSTIGGGLRNCATSDYSAILGGRCNNASTYADAMIIGSCITATKACTTHVNSLNIVDTPTTDTDSLDTLSWDPTSKEVKLRNINGMIYAMSTQTVFI